MIANILIPMAYITSKCRCGHIFQINSNFYLSLSAALSPFREITQTQRSPKCHRQPADAVASGLPFEDETA